MLVSKDESLKDSMVHVGYHVVRCLEGAEDRRRSLVEVMHYLKGRHINDYRSIQFALLFLHSVGSVEFRAPYLCLAPQDGDAPSP